MESIKVLNLDFRGISNIIQTLKAVQYDDGRAVRVMLSGTQGNISKVRIYCQKPSGMETYTDGTIVNDYCVLFGLTPQMLAEEGIVKSQLQLMDGEHVVTSFDFQIQVSKNRIASSSITSSNEYQALVEALKNVDKTEADISQNRSEISIIKGRVDTAEQNIDVHTAQIAEMQKIPEGGTTADAALNDIRVDSEGNVWDTPGAAVRGQSKQILGFINDAAKQLRDTIGILPLYWEKGSINQYNGELIENERYYRTKLVAINPGSCLGCVVPDGKCLYTFEYDQMGDFINYYEYQAEDFDFIVKDNTYYVRFAVRNATGSDPATESVHDGVTVCTTRNSIGGFVRNLFSSNGNINDDDDFDDYIKTGMWYVGSSFRGKRPVEKTGDLLVFGYSELESNGGVSQIYLAYDELCIRQKVSNSWTKWVRIRTYENTKHSTPEVFSFNMVSLSEREKALLVGYKEQYTSIQGYEPTGGWSDLVMIDKYIVSDDVAYRAVIELSEQDKGVVALGTKTASYLSSNHATIVRFDFDNRKMEFLAGAVGGGNYSGEELPSYVYNSVDMTNVSGTSYRIEIGRKDRCPYAKVVNIKTGLTCAEKVLTEYGTELSYGGKAGSLYDYPTFAVISGSVIFKRLSCVVPIDKFAVFVGDSITQGAQVSFENCWSKRAADYLGNSLTLGRGGGTIDNVIDCLQDIVGKIRPKYVFVTIGTNGGNTDEKLNTVVHLIREMGAIPIINCIPRMQTSVKDINDKILALDTEHIRFDIATSINNDLNEGQNMSLFQSDKVHPNEEGNTAMYNRFLADMDWIKI